MSSTPPPEALPLERLLSRPVLIAAAALVLAAGLAWAWLLANATGPTMDGMGDIPMSGMTMGPELLSTSYLVASFAMWALMMVAMMLPSAAPMILLHARIDRGSRAERARNNAAFMLSYVSVWTLFSAVAALAQALLIDTGLLSSARLAVGDNTFAAGLLMVAAVWQLTSAKAACLEQCQSPIQFVMRYWRPGVGGAIRLGLIHGGYCVGCCWSLMLLLFVGGAMNLAWAALLAAVVFVEKVAPARWRVSRWLAGFLAIAAIAMLVT